MRVKRVKQRGVDSSVASASGLEQSVKVSTDVGRRPRAGWLQKFGSKQKKIFAVSLVLVVLSLGVGISVVFRSSSKPPAKPLVTSEGVELRKLNGVDLQRELQRLVYEKKFSSAEQMVQYQNAVSSYNLQMMLVALYMNQGQLDQARDVLLRLEALNPDAWQTPRTLGDVYRRQGNKPEALAAYQRALEHLKNSNDSMRNDEAYLIEQAIKQVGG